MKSDRGDVNRAGRVFDAHHRRARYAPAWKDLTIRRYVPALRQNHAEMKAGPLGALHADFAVSHDRKMNIINKMVEFILLRQHLLMLPSLPPGERELKDEPGARTVSYQRICLGLSTTADPTDSPMTSPAASPMSWRCRMTATTAPMRRATGSSSWPRQPPAQPPSPQAARMLCGPARGDAS